jgi:TolA-binding protein
VRKCIVLFAIVVLSGCASLGLQSGSEKDFQDATVSVKEKKYSAALAGFQNILREAPNSDLAKDAQLEIALIHTVPDNPQKDFIQAIHEFETFLKLHPDDQRVPEARAWIAVLRAVHDLKKENELLKKNIEELKQLDIRHEERRRK